MSTFPLPFGYYHSIGVLTTELAGLERLTTTAIRFCCSLSTWDEAVCLVGGDQLDVLFKKLEKLVKTNLKDESALLTEFDSIFKSLDSINKKRNTYIHSLWTYSSPFDKDAGIRRRKFFRAFNTAKGLEDIESTTVADIDKFTDEVIATREKLTSFFTDNLETIHNAIHRRKSEEASR